MGQDEAIKVVGAIVAVVLVIAIVVFITGRTSKQADQLTGQNVEDANEAVNGAVGSLTGGNVPAGFDG